MIIINKKSRNIINYRIFKSTSRAMSCLPRHQEKWKDHYGFIECCSTKLLNESLSTIIDFPFYARRNVDGHHHPGKCQCHTALVRKTSRIVLLVLVYHQYTAIQNEIGSGRGLPFPERIQHAHSLEPQKHSTKRVRVSTSFNGMAVPKTRKI